MNIENYDNYNIIGYVSNEHVDFNTKEAVTDEKRDNSESETKPITTM